MYAKTGFVFSLSMHLSPLLFPTPCIWRNCAIKTSSLGDSYLELNMRLLNHVIPKNPPSHKPKQFKVDWHFLAARMIKRRLKNDENFIVTDCDVYKLNSTSNFSERITFKNLCQNWDKKQNLCHRQTEYIFGVETGKKATV